MKATKKRSVILAVAMAVLMILMFVYALKASAEDAAVSEPQDAVVLTEEAAADDVKVLDESEKVAEEEAAAPKTNALVSVIAMVVAVGAIVVCLREIRRDNKH